MAEQELLYDGDYKRALELSEKHVKAYLNDMPELRKLFCSNQALKQ